MLIPVQHHLVEHPFEHHPAFGGRKRVDDGSKASAERTPTDILRICTVLRPDDVCENAYTDRYTG